MKRETLLGLTLFVLFVFSPLFVITPLSGIQSVPMGSLDNGSFIAANTQTALISTNPIPLPEGPTYEDNEYLYTGLGSGLETNEFAYGVNSSSVLDLDYGSNNIGEITHPVRWDGYQLTAAVSNLFDNNTWIDPDTRNGDFEDTWTDWSYTSNGLGAQVSDPYHGGNWSTSYGRSGNGVRVWINYSTGISFQTTDYSAFQQTFTLTREPDWARLTFDVKVDHNPFGTKPNYWDRDELAIYVELGGKAYLLTVDYYLPAIGEGNYDSDWVTIVLPIPYNDIIQWGAPGSLNLKLGLGFIIDFTSNIQAWALWFDNVQFEVQGKAQPADSTIGLQLNNTAVANGASYGTGTVSLTPVGGWPSRSTTYQLQAIWNTTATASKDVAFDYTLNFFVNKTSTTEQQTGPDGTTFSVSQGSSNVYWTTWFYVANPIPGVYQQYNLSITKPTSETWSKNQIWNALSEDKTTAVTDDGTHLRLSPSTIGTVYGWWNFTLSSPNRVTAVSGVQPTYYINPRSPSTLSITVSLSKTTGEVNLTLYDYDGIVRAEDSKPAGASVGFTVNFNNGDSYPAGQYILCISYDDGVLVPPTAAGFFSSQFNLIHASTLTPEASSMNVNRGPGFFYPRVYFNDTDKATNPFIITPNVTGSVDGNTITFYQAGSWYEAKISNNLLLTGDYILTVTANETYHDPIPATCNINLHVRTDTTLSSATPGYTAYYLETFTIQVFYEDANNQGITGAAGWFTTPSWSGTSITPGGSNGWYDVQVPTSVKPLPGTYTLTVAVDDPGTYYEAQAINLTIVIRARNTLLTSTTPSSVPYGARSNFTVTLSDLDGGTPPNNSTNKLHLHVMRGTTQWNPTMATVTFSGSAGVWNISIDTSYLPAVGNYNFKVYFYWYGSPDNTPFYGNRSVDVSVSVREIGTTISYDPPSPEPWGNDMVVTVYYEIDDPVYFPSTGITSIIDTDVSCTLNGAPYATFGWQEIGSGEYAITIYSSAITQVDSYTFVITIDDTTDDYQSASRTIVFSVRKRLTQVIVIPPAQIPYQANTSITFSWYDLDGGTDPLITDIFQVRVTGYGDPQIFTPSSWTITLVTDTWVPGEYNLILTIIPDDPPGVYNQTASAVTVLIIIHQTAVTILPPEPTPWGENTTITIQWVDLSTTGYISYTAAAQIIISGDVSKTINNPTSWTFELDTSSLTIVGSPYSITIEVVAKTIPAQIYADSNSTFNELTIRGHRVYVLVTGPAPVPEGGSFLLNISWIDLDKGSAIDSGTYLQEVRVTQISGPSAPTLPWSNFSYLDFYIDATGWGRGLHELNVTVFANDPRFATGFGTVNIIIRVHSITADVDPIPRVPYGNNISIILRVNDSDLIPPSGLPENHLTSVVITGGPSTITLDSSNWHLWVNNGTADDGIYQIILDVSGWSLDTYALQFDVTTSAEYGNGVVLTQLTIRSLATSFTYQSPPVVPWGENGILIVTFLVDDPTAVQDNSPITGGTISITDLTLGVDFNFVYWENGKYNITFYSSILTEVKEFQFDITITRAEEYEVGQLDAVPLSVRALFTWLHPTTVPITPFGDNVTIEVEYIVLDGESSLNQDPIHTGSETINVTGLDGFNPTVIWWEWDGILSIYRITINASEVTAIQAYKIMIRISGSGSGYENDTIPELTFNVRTVFTALAVEPVDAQAFLDNFTIRITYTVNDPDSSINGQGIDGQESIIELVEYPGLYSVIPLGSGIYDIVINSTGVGAPSTYLATINTDWAQFPPPYAIQTKQVTLFVVERPTSIQNTITGEYGYLTEITVNFTYSDQLRTFSITNTSFGGNHVLVVLYNTTPALPVLIPFNAWYIVSITGDYDFQLRIDADYFGRVNTFFDFKLEVSWEGGTIPYFETQEFEFRAYVVGQRTEFVLQPTAGATPWNSTMTFEFLFQTIEGMGINSTYYPDISITLLCEELPSFGTYGSDWWVTDLGQGFYEISIDTTKLAGIGTYLFYVNVTYPKGLDPFFESKTNRPVLQEVREIETILSYDPPGNLYYGENLTLIVRYFDLDNNNHVPNIPTTVNIQVTGFVGVTISQISSGPKQYWWQIELNTAGVPALQGFSIYIFANQTNFLFQNISVPVYIYEVPLDITLESLGLISRFYGQTPYEIIEVTVKIGAGLHQGDLVNDSQVDCIWAHGTLNFVFIGAGVYQLEIQSEYTIGQYTLSIQASKAGFYQDATTYVTYTITAGPSILTTYNCTTSFLVYPPEDIIIYVNFTTGAGVPIIGANVTFFCADPAIGFGSPYLIELDPALYPGIYYYDSSIWGVDTSSDLVTVPYEISVSAESPNVQRRTLSFTADVRYTPAEVLAFDIDYPSFENESYFMTYEYQEVFTLWIFANNTRSGILDRNITGALILATWGGQQVSLNELGNGWYWAQFTATQAAGFSYSLYVDLKGAFDVQRTTITIDIIDRSTRPVTVFSAWSILVIDDIIEYNRSAYEGGVLTVPVGDWIYIYFDYRDVDGFLVANGSGTITLDGVILSGIPVEFDNSTNLYLLKLYIDPITVGIGSHSLSIRLGKANFLSQIYPDTFTAIEIPTRLTVDEIIGIVPTPPEYPFEQLYIGSPFQIRVYFFDTWHRVGIEGANITLPQGWDFDPAGPEGGWIEEGNGYYLLYGLRSATPITLELRISANKGIPVPYQETGLETEVILEFVYHPLFVYGTIGGTIAAIFLIFILIGWILWARVLSIPWEVRRMRKLAKTVEKDETYSLGRKDLKHFHERGVILEGKVDSAMSTIGVVMTPAMIPTIEELEEVTATEEDIVAELDKIPGLGAEEKAVLAEEMRKIPRKDRIWFLDDLRRQMSERRMDFITKREKAPPAIKPELKPTKKPPMKPTKKPAKEPPAKPLDEVKPVEPPPPEKALEGDRTAPTVVPPEERVTPEVPSGVEIEIRRELDKIPGLSDEEKQALVDHLKYLSKEERQATYFSLKQSADES